MAFGPSTPLVQQALLTLLQGQTPSPLAPVPLAPTNEIGPLDFDTTAALAALQPQPVPAPLPGPVDANAIRSQFMGTLGPEPVAPPVEPTSLIIRVARALQGFGAGVQGRGPEYLEKLREQQEAPMREFQAKKDTFDQRKQRLGLMAEEAILTAEDRRMARTMKLIDDQADRDFQKAAAASGIKKTEALERLRGAIDMERDARKAEAERLEQERKDAKERKVRADNIAKELFDDLRISRQQARAFAEFEVNQTPLSKADARVYSRLEKYRRPVGGAGAVSGSDASMVQRTISEFETLKNLAIQGVKAKGGSIQDETEAVRKATAGVVRKMARRPDLYEVGAGAGGYLYSKPRQGGQPQFSSSPAPGAQPHPSPTPQMNFDLSGGPPSVGPAAQQQQAGQTKIISIQAIRAAAKEAGVSEAEAIEDFKRNGYAIAYQN